MSAVVQACAQAPAVRARVLREVAAALRAHAVPVECVIDVFCPCDACEGCDGFNIEVAPELAELIDRLAAFEEGREAYLRRERAPKVDEWGHGWRGPLAAPTRDDGEESSTERLIRLGLAERVIVDKVKP